MRKNAVFIKIQGDPRPWVFCGWFDTRDEAREMAGWHKEQSSMVIRARVAPVSTEDDFEAIASSMA